MKKLILFALLLGSLSVQALDIRVHAGRVTCATNGSMTFAVHVDNEPVLTWVYTKPKDATAAKFWCEGVLHQALTDARVSAYVTIDSNAPSNDTEAIKLEYVSNCTP